jgi:tetratricopeptide (TPR) repeat protein
MNKNLIVVLLIILAGCKAKDASSQGQLLFQKASAILRAAPDNTDSLNHAISLIDSAIGYDKNNVEYLLAESHIFIGLKRYNKAIDACNHVLAIDRNNFFAVLTKGVVYDRLNNSDSSHTSYREALNSLEQTKFSSDIFKDYQRIIIYGLLNDTTQFKSRLNEFQKYRGKSSDFPAFYDELKNFKKEEFVDSY